MFIRFVKFNQMFVNFYVMFFLTNYKPKLTNLSLKLINSAILQKCLEKGYFFKEGSKIQPFCLEALSNEIIWLSSSFGGQY